MKSFKKYVQSCQNAVEADIISDQGGKSGQDYAALCVVDQLVIECKYLLAEARKLTASKEILLWMTPSEAPKALQASECSELLDPMRASCWISAQH